MKCTGEDILNKLKSTYTIDSKEYVAYDVWIKFKDPFRVLIATLLSQNSTDKGTYKAFYTLENKIRVTPQNLINATVSEIADCIKNIGIYNIKAQRIKEISKIVLEKYGGKLDEILNKPLKEAREELLSLTGVGEKTADVVLLTCKSYPTFPVDTHIKRVATRLGIVKSSKYSSISNELMKLFQPKDYLVAHQLLIAHGRKACKAKNPLCESCVLKECCKYYDRLRESKKFNSS